MPLIETVAVSHRYGPRQVLRNIDLKVERGEVLAVIGPNGAGKSTLLRLIDLLEKPSSGNIYFAGMDVTGAGKRQLEVRRRMALVLQKPVVFDASVYDNIACGLKWRSQTSHQIRGRVEHLLELVKLSPFRDKNARTLSGGEAQRVALARAVAFQPEVLLLDEPTANLDPVSAIKMEELIHNIFQQYHTTIIMATHDLAQGRRLANTVAVLVNGEIIQAGRAEEVFGSPLSQEVAEFVGFENIISGVIAASDGEIATINLSGKAIEAISNQAVGEAVYACIRAEDITLAPAKVASSARNSLVGEVTRITLRGSLASIEVNCGFPLIALLTRKSVEMLNLKVGQPVYASFKATAVHVLQKT